MNRFPAIRAALLRYDPNAKCVVAIKSLDNGVRVTYLDHKRREFSVTLREAD